MIRWGVVGLLLLVAGCRPASPPPPQFEPWILTCESPVATMPAVLWNGLIGVRIGRSGAGTALDDTPLPAFDAFGYEQTDQERLIVQPNPFVMTWFVNDEQIDVRRAEGYRQALDMRTGLLVTSYTVVAGGRRARIETTTAIDPLRKAIAQTWTVSTDQPAKLRAESRVALEEPPSGSMFLSEISAALQQYLALGNAEDVRYGSLEVRHRSSVPGVLDRGVCRFEIEGDRMSLVKSAEFSPEPPPPYSQIEAASEDAWQSRWACDIEIDGPPQDQQAIRSFLFYLRSAIQEKSPQAIAPFGLSDPSYGGHVFWDADIWVFPALAFIDPASASAIPRYRFSNMRLPPWESSVSGREVAPPESRGQLHVWGDVAWSMDLAAKLGLIRDIDAFLVGSSVREGFLRRIERTPRGLELKGVMSPDEFHFGDNDLYTNMIAEWTIRRFSPANAPPITLFKPRDERSFLTYEGDLVRSYQQASALLTVFPLQNPEAEKEAAVMLDRFADKVTPYGPAMSDSVHATIFARIGDVGRAYVAWHRSWMEFTDHPLMLFTEKRTKDVAYFTTGAAGSLQTVIFGFLGFRIDDKKDSGAKWSKPLNGGAWLNVTPHLPKLWKSVRFKNFTVLGERYDLTATQDSLIVTQGVP